MKTFEDIYELVESGWGYEEILREVEIRRRETVDIALGWMLERALERADCVPDASDLEQEAGRCAIWCDYRKTSLDVQQAQA